ncbi:MAG: oligosaccharide flippase family protein [Methanobacterium sp.]|nr:oligosaccharide flippase family protein [Methanobacterium sp.]
MQKTAPPSDGIILRRRRLAAFPSDQIRRLREMLARRPFLKNVSIMLTGSAGGQMISILLSPVLTRLYSPQQFGILSAYSAILAMLVVISSLRYELALPLARGDEDAINLTVVCICALGITTAAVGAAVFLLPAPLLAALWPVPLDRGHATAYRMLLVSGYFCLGGYFIALYFATRANAFRPIAKTRLAQGVIGPLTQIGLALLGGGAPALMIGSVVGQSAGTFGLFYTVMTGRRALLRAVSWSRVVDMARRYIRFPLIGSWAALIDAIGGNQLLYLLITAHYSVRIAGFIFLAERIVSRPLAIVGASILHVFVGEAGQTAGAGPAKLRSRFYQVVSRQFALAAIWGIVTNVAGASMFPIVFGAEWNDGVVYLQAISLGYLAQAVVQPVFHTLQILEKQYLAASWQIGRLVLTIAAFALGDHLGLRASWVVASYSAVQAASCAILVLLMARAIQQLQR